MSHSCPLHSLCPCEFNHFSKWRVYCPWQWLSHDKIMRIFKSRNWHNSRPNKCTIEMKWKHIHYPCSGLNGRETWGMQEDNFKLFHPDQLKFVWKGILHGSSYTSKSIIVPSCFFLRQWVNGCTGAVCVAGSDFRGVTHYLSTLFNFTQSTRGW